jgi:hypothetical protein
MYMLYALLFILALTVSIGSPAKREAERVHGESEAVALQLAAWHRAALDKCLKEGCGNGRVAPTDVMRYLPQHIAARINSQWFVAYHDASGRYVASYLSGTFQSQQNAWRSLGSVAAALWKSGMDGHTNAAGTWNGTSIEPMRSYVAPGLGGTLPGINLPAGAFPGFPIPTGSPVIATRL